MLRDGQAVVNRFGLMFTGDIRRQRVCRMRGASHWRWHLDDMYVWGAMDQKLAVIGAGYMRS